MTSVAYASVCFPKYLCVGTARMKSHKDIEKEGKTRRANIERSTEGTKKNPDELTISGVYRPRGRHSPKQSMNYLTNLALHL